MSNVWWAHGGGPLSCLAGGYGAELTRLGFTHNSVVTHLVLMGQLSRWMSAVGVAVGDLSEGRVEGFFDARRAGGQRRVPTVRTLAPLFGYLRGQGLVPPPEAGPSTPLEDLLMRYRGHLLDDRGLAGSTVVGYEGRARRFLSERILAECGETGIEGLCGGDVAGFLRRECSRLSVGSAKNRVNDLRSLLRFLYLEGLIPSDLAVAVPPVAGWRDTGMAPGLAACEVAELVSSCDRTRPTGLRDFAIMMLLVRLGLRSCEVVGLELEDINWRAGELRVRGKGGGEDRLPLPSDVGEALAAYLRDGRPRAESRRVFLTCLAPRRGLRPGSLPASEPDATGLVHTDCAMLLPPKCSGKERRCLRSLRYCVTAISLLPRLTPKSTSLDFAAPPSRGREATDESAPRARQRVPAIASSPRPQPG